MLVLTRKAGQKVVIGENIVIEVVSIGGDSIRLGIAAPPEVPVHREEVFEAIRAANEAAFTNSHAAPRESITLLARRLQSRPKI